MASTFTATLDTRAQEAWLRRYTTANVEKVMDEAAKAGGTSARNVLKIFAPIGTSVREGQYYRRNGLGHGTFKASIKAAKIRGRQSALKALQGKTVGYVIGPMGKNAFTRYWIEGGTSGPGRHRQRANPWVEHIASTAFLAARKASELRLMVYAHG